MQTLDQQPLDFPRPALSAAARRWENVKLGILWFAILCMILAIAAPLFPQRLSADRTEALNNVRQVGLSLAEFDAEYGRFPDASTISAVKAKTGTSLTLDVTSSNRLFRQLLAHGLKSERPFWAKTRNSPRKPDDIFNADNKALMPGECAFSYIAGLSSKDDPATPIVMVPLLKGTTNFDRTQYRGKAIILFLDNSAKALPIDQYGRVTIGGMDLFDPRQPFWKGKAPDIKWPE